jgi:hypothetical protein
MLALLDINQRRNVVDCQTSTKASSDQLEQLALAPTVEEDSHGRITRGTAQKSRKL